jgi:hypothetical protein
MSARWSIPLCILTSSKTVGPAHAMNRRPHFVAI